MIFAVLKWYAILRGVQQGLRKPRPTTLADFDRLLARYYVEPLRLWSETPVRLRFERAEP